MKNVEQILVEMFGDPLEPKMGMDGKRIGELPGITKVGAVGVRDMHVNELGDVCPGCGMMSVDGKCGCPGSDVCPRCGMMPNTIDAACSCGMNEEAKSCEACGMDEATCECGYMSEAKKDEKVKTRKYRGEKYKASAGSVAALKKHGGSKENAVKAGAFSWAKDPYAAARGAEIVMTGKAKPTRGPKAED